MHNVGFVVDDEDEENPKIYTCCLKQLQTSLQGMPKVNASTLTCKYDEESYGIRANSHRLRMDCEKVLSRSSARLDLQHCQMLQTVRHCSFCPRDVKNVSTVSPELYLPHLSSLAVVNRARADIHGLSGFPLHCSGHR